MIIGTARTGTVKEWTFGKLDGRRYRKVQTDDGLTWLIEPNFDAGAKEGNRVEFHIYEDGKGGIFNILPF